MYKLIIILIIFTLDTFGATLKSPIISVEGSSIYLKDVLDGLDEKTGEIYLDKSPGVYSPPVTISKYRLKQLARRYNIELHLDNNFPSEIIIQRETIKLPKEAIISQIKSALVPYFPNSKISITVSEPIYDLVVAKGKNQNVRLITHTQNSFTAQVDNTILTGRIEPLVSVPVLNKPINTDDIIESQDLTWNDIPKTSLPNQALLDINDIVGKKPKIGTLEPFKPLVSRQLESPILIRKGELATIVYERPNVVITTKGRAKSHAAKGDTITFETDDKQPIDATVEEIGVAYVI